MSAESAKRCVGRTAAAADGAVHGTGTHLRIHCLAREEERALDRPREDLPGPAAADDRVAVGASRPGIIEPVVGPEAGDEARYRAGSHSEMRGQRLDGRREKILRPLAHEPPRARTSDPS